MLFTIIKILYIVTVLVSLLGILQIIFYEIFGLYIGGALGYPYILPTSLRATGAFNNPNLYGFFLHLGYSISLTSLLLYRKIRVLSYKFRNILFCHLIILFALIASGSKGAFFSLIISSSIIIILILIKKKILPLILILSTIPLVWVLINIDLLYSLIFKEDGNENERFLLWSYTFKMFEEKPLLGYGMNSFRIINNIDVIPHNLYFQTLSENGLVGILILILIFITCITYLLIVCKKSNYDEYFLIALALLGGLSGMLVHSVSLSSINNTMLWIVIALCVNLYLIFKEERVKKNEKSTDLSRSTD